MFYVNSLFVQHFLKGVDEVRLANAKLQSDAGSAALKLMDCVFSTAEMVNGNPSGVTRSKDETRQKTIRPLDAQKMRYIDGMIFCLWYTVYIAWNFGRHIQFGKRLLF